MSEPPPLDVRWETTACPLCGEELSSTILVARDLHYFCPGEFTLARCETCRHAFLNPRPTRECIGQFYPTDYGPYQPASPESHRPSAVRSRFDPRSWHWLRRLVLWWIDSRATPIPEFPISNLKSQMPPRALELGCSHGAFLQQLRDRGWECVGIEPAAEAARLATERGFDVRTGSLESALAADPQTFAPSRFDAVFAWMVIEHLHDPVATLRHARELLRPNGTLLFNVPNFGCWEWHAFGRVWYALECPRHLQQFTVASLRRLLQASGFELVELIHQRNVINLVGSVGIWLRLKFPRWSLGERLILWTHNPSALGLCLLAPLARLLAVTHQAGRLTIVARRADSRSG